jgi:hypothetical protein
MKAYRGRKGRAPLNLNSAASLYDRFTPRKVSRYPLNRRLGGPGAGLDVLDKTKIFAFTGI